MHHFTRLITAIFLTILSIILLFSALFAYLIVTPLGGKILVRCFKQEFTSVGLLHIGGYEGSLQDGFVLKDVQITGLSYLPDSLLRIQEIHVRLPLWDPIHSDFSIFNARLYIPDSDPVVFTGRVYAGRIKGNLYANSVDVQAASRFWAGEDIKKNLQGFISNVDVRIMGAITSPRITGHLVVDNIRYKSIVFTDGFSRVNLMVLPKMHRWQLKGVLIIDSGLVNVRKKDLDLSRSRIIFQGDAFDPLIALHLGAKVEDMDINLSIKGLLNNPQLTVSSDPPMAPQDALQVLFTGNAFASSTSPFHGVTSNELAENFLDYSLNDVNSAQDLGLKTRLTDNLKLGVEMDQMPTSPGERNVYYSRKINGEMDLSEHMSLNVSQEVLSQARDTISASSSAQTPDETQVYVQYKKRF